MESSRRYSSAFLLLSSPLRGYAYGREMGLFYFLFSLAGFLRVVGKWQRDFESPRLLSWQNLLEASSLCFQNRIVQIAQGYTLVF